MTSGQGAYTVMSQIAADELGLPLEDVTFKYRRQWLSTPPRFRVDPSPPEWSARR